MTRTTIVNVAVGAVAVGLVTTGMAWTLLDNNDTRAVAPVAVTSVSDTSPSAEPTDGATVPSDDPSSVASAGVEPGDDSGGHGSDDGTGSGHGSDDASQAGGAVAVPEGVTVDRAREIALGLKGGSVTETELEEEHGRTAWKVELRTASGAEWKVYVDALTGDVIKSKQD